MDATGERDLIRAYLQRQSIVSLTRSVDDGSCTKAGVVPFTRGDGYRYYLLKPRGALPDLGDPPFQMCKGTRQFWTGSEWKDMRGIGLSAEQKETIAETALREGIEELGLKLDNIDALFDMGMFAFSSATTGKPKSMWLFAAEMHDMDDFLPESATTQVTQLRDWFELADFKVVGRPDHLYILEQIEARRREHFRE